MYFSILGTPVWSQQIYIQFGPKECKLIQHIHIHLKISYQSEDILGRAPNSKFTTDQ